MMGEVRSRLVSQHNRERFGNIDQLCIAVEAVQARDLFALLLVRHACPPGKRKSPRSTDDPSRGRGFRAGSRIPPSNGRVKCSARHAVKRFLDRPRMPCDVRGVLLNQILGVRKFPVDTSRKALHAVRAGFSGIRADPLVNANVGAESSGVFAFIPLFRMICVQSRHAAKLSVRIVCLGAQDEKSVSGAPGL